MKNNIQNKASLTETKEDKCEREKKEERDLAINDLEAKHNQILGSVQMEKTSEKGGSVFGGSGSGGISSGENTNVGRNGVNANNRRSTTTTTITRRVIPGAYRVGGTSTSSVTSTPVDIVDDAVSETEQEPEHTPEDQLEEQAEQAQSVPLDAKVVDDSDFEMALQERMNSRTVMASSIVPGPSPSTIIKTQSKTLSKEEGGGSSTANLRIAIFALGVIFLVIAMTLIFSWDESDGNSKLRPDAGSPAIQDSVDETSSADDLRAKTKIIRNLVTSVVLNQTTLDDKSTPQHQALSWLLQDVSNKSSSAATAALDEEDDHDDSYKKLQLVERYILAVLYYALDGPKWSLNLDFLSEVSHCDWPTERADQDVLQVGIACNDQGSVVEIRIRDNGLNGTLPAEIMSLSSLQKFDLWDNAGIYGRLPTEIGSMKQLKFLRLGKNGITGSIPNNYSNLRKLKQFVVSNTFLTGTIPKGLYQSTELEKLMIRNNRMHGTLPESVPGQALREIWVENQDFVGTIPESLYMPSLEVLSVWGNDFTGTLSTLIGTLDELWLLSAALQKLEGTIPSEIGLASNLDYVYLSGNMFTGPIPTQFGLITRLKTLQLHDNDLTGTIPIVLASLPAHLISFDRNRLTGTLDEFCEQKRSFTEVRADCLDNSFEGLGAAVKDCPCCSKCCDVDSGECETNLLAVCNLETNRYDSEDGDYYLDGAGAECDCTVQGESGDSSYQSTMKCLDNPDGPCETCNLNRTVCAIHEEYRANFRDGHGFPWTDFNITFQYVKGRNDTITWQKWFDEDFNFGCDVTVNGQKCNSCYVQICPSGHNGNGVDCSNIIDGPGGRINVCDSGQDEMGPLAVFTMQDPLKRSGCPPRFPVHQ